MQKKFFIGFKEFMLVTYNISQNFCENLKSPKLNFKPEDFYIKIEGYGSDAISNIFMRAMYKAIGVKTYPIKKDVSLDLEAYCTNIDEYKKLFTSYFDKAPEIIE